MKLADKVRRFSQVGGSQASAWKSLRHNQLRCPDRT